MFAQLRSYKSTFQLYPPCPTTPPRARGHLYFAQSSFEGLKRPTPCLEDTFLARTLSMFNPPSWRRDITSRWTQRVYILISCSYCAHSFVIYASRFCWLSMQTHNLFFNVPLRRKNLRQVQGSVPGGGNCDIQRCLSKCDKTPHQELCPKHQYIPGCSLPPHPQHKHKQHKAKHKHASSAEPVLCRLLCSIFTWRAREHSADHRSARHPLRRCLRLPPQCHPRPLRLPRPTPRGLPVPLGWGGEESHLPPALDRWISWNQRSQVSYHSTGTNINPPRVINLHNMRLWMEFQPFTQAWRFSSEPSEYRKETEEFCIGLV